MSRHSRRERIETTLERGHESMLRWADPVFGAPVRWLGRLLEAIRSAIAGRLRSLARESSGVFWHRSGQHYAAALGWFLSAFAFASILRLIEPVPDAQGDLAVPGSAFAFIIVLISSWLMGLRRLVAAVCRVTGEQAKEHDPWRADRYGIAGLVLLFIPTVVLGLIWGGPGLADAQTPLAVLTALFAVAIFSDWASRPRTLSKTLLAQPDQPRRRAYTGPTPKQGAIHAPDRMPRGIGTNR